MKRFFLLLSVGLLSACSSGGNDGGLAIPGDLPFDEKSLPAISDADFAQAKSVAATGGTAVAMPDQLLIEKDEESYDKQDRERKFRNLKPELQQLVTLWKPSCPTEESGAGDARPGLPEAGKTYRTDKTLSTTGALCPVLFSQKTNSAMAVSKYTQNPPAYAIGLTGNGSLSAAFKEPNQQRTVGASGFDIQFNIEGRFEGADGKHRSFTRMGGSGSMDTLGYGKVTITAAQENLELPETEKKLSTYRFHVDGKTFVFTQVSHQQNKNMPEVRYFIGNRELTREDVIAMGEFPFSVSGTGVNSIGQKSFEALR